MFILREIRPKELCKVIGVYLSRLGQETSDPRGTASRVTLSRPERAPPHTTHLHHGHTNHERVKCGRPVRACGFLSAHLDAGCTEFASQHAGVAEKDNRARKKIKKVESKLTKRLYYVPIHAVFPHVSPVCSLPAMASWLWVEQVQTRSTNPARAQANRIN